MIQDSESLEFYFRDITSSEPLSGDEELELSQRIHKGDQKARDKLVLANLRFVVLVARKYQNCGLSMAELISAGNIGLMTAVERFDGTRGFKFISYAVWWIRQAIQKSLLEEPWVVRLPLNRIALLRNIARISQEFQQTRDVEPEILAVKLGVSVEMVRDTLMLAQGVLSLDAPVSEDDDHSLLDMLADHTQRPPDTEAVEGSVREQIEKALNTLDVRDAEVLRLYFGLDEEPMTLEEVGGRLNLTRERIRQIKEKALSQLRHPRRRAQLEPLLEPV